MLPLPSPRPARPADATLARPLHQNHIDLLPTMTQSNPYFETHKRHGTDLFRWQVLARHRSPTLSPKFPFTRYSVAPARNMHAALHVYAFHAGRNDPLAAERPHIYIRGRGTLGLVRARRAGQPTKITTAPKIFAVATDCCCSDSCIRSTRLPHCAWRGKRQHFFVFVISTLRSRSSRRGIRCIRPSSCPSEAVIRHR